MNGLIKTTLTLVLSLCVCGTAYAHAHLLQSSPSEGATVTSTPNCLTLDFSEGLQLSFTGITLHGPGGMLIETKDAKLSPTNDKELRIPLSRQLSSGNYTVEWHALSDDGHTTHGSYEFSVSN